QREIDRLLPLGHPVLIVDLSGCDYLDVEGLMTLLETGKRLHREGRRLALVAGSGRTARLLRVLGIDMVLPVFPSQDVADLALRGGGPPHPAPANWEKARGATLARWRRRREPLGRAPEEARPERTPSADTCT